jgi:hypothetical protein
MSVNRNVTTPEGAAARSADTPAESHKRSSPTSYIGGSGPVTHNVLLMRSLVRFAYCTSPSRWGRTNA